MPRDLNHLHLLVTAITDEEYQMTRLNSAPPLIRSACKIVCISGFPAGRLQLQGCQAFRGCRQVVDAVFLCFFFFSFYMSALSLTLLTEKTEKTVMMFSDRQVFSDRINTFQICIKNDSITFVEIFPQIT